MTIKEMYDMFLFEQEYRNNSPRTIEWYREKLDEFYLWLQSDDPADLTLLNFKQYGIYLKNQHKRNGDKLSSSSVQGSLRAIKAFYNFLIGEEYLEDFSRQLKLPRVYKKEKLILADYEIRALMQCGENNRFALRNKCFVTLMLDSGLRRGEIPRINVSDVNLRNCTLLVRGKCNKQRLVPLGVTSAELLAKYISTRDIFDSSAPLFVDMYGKRCTDNLMKQVFQDFKQSSGIERLHPHLLRHTFATYYLADGGDLETLRLILGHSNIQTTQNYLHMAFNLKLSRSRHNSHLDSLLQE